MRFEKGRSGNPGGRPKGHGDIRELARAHTALALQTLVEVASRGENESARVAAATAILDRGWGKPTLPIGEEEIPLAITFNMGNRSIRVGEHEVSPDDVRQFPALVQLNEDE